MMRTVISEDYDVEAVDEWCEAYGVRADWQPLWCNGAVAGWCADLSPDDHLIFRLRFGYEKAAPFEEAA